MKVKCGVLFFVVFLLFPAVAMAQSSPDITPNVVTASSQYNASYGPEKAIDGSFSTEWATAGETGGAWIQLDWTQPVTVDGVTLADRANSTDHITSSHIEFSDGSTVDIPYDLPNDGSALYLSFGAKTGITWLRYVVDTADGQNIGLAEIVIYGNMPTSTPAPTSTATSTAVPPPTSTNVPTATNTAVPSATSTNVPTATPGGDVTLTPEATATAGTPQPTPTTDPNATPTPTPEAVAFIDTIPGPIPLQPVNDTIDLAPFWDISTFTMIASIIQTFFYLENIPEFFQVFLFGMGMVIGLRLIVSIIRRRAKSRQPDI